ncbi:hypothetical protein DS891_04095 [Pseudoalteromonas sp. JC28]|uniref:hypothetical protein n=1 Tax=Pseudoalteromonas sp. JC28 TaxID=2267617 RepID=UPI001572D7D4|nr:hypothetical protein [Pseudoalteromonas sp. JC28]NSY32782.1 hypothetical protein [Pseudoalteromonas sp. JC28]
MFERIKDLMSKGIWHSLAIIIVFLMAGPEIMMGMELMALIEVLGASTFVLLYFTGVKLFLLKVWKQYQKFECHSVLFVPPLVIFKQMPSLIVHAIPERTVVIFFFGFIVVGMSGVLINSYIGA